MSQQFQAQTKSVKAVNVDNQNHSESDDDEVPCHLADEYMFALKSGEKPTVDVTIDSHRCSMIIDTGCARNIIDETTYRQLNVKLEKSDIRLLPYGTKTPLNVLGKFTGVIETNKQATTAEIYV